MLPSGAIDVDAVATGWVWLCVRCGDDLLGPRGLAPTLPIPLARRGPRPPTRGLSSGFPDCSGSVVFGWARTEQGHARAVLVAPTPTVESSWVIDPAERAYQNCPRHEQPRIVSKLDQIVTGQSGDLSDNLVQHLEALCSP